MDQASPAPLLDLDTLTTRNFIAIDGQRIAGWNAILVGGIQDVAADRPHLFFQKAGCTVGKIAAKRVAAYQLG